MKFNYNHFLLISALFYSCYSTTEVDLPNENPFIVVNSVNFQPDSTWLIEVSKSDSYLNNNNHTLNDDAVLILKDELGLEIELLPEKINNRTFYVSDQKPETGKSYTLTINASGFPEVSAKSAIPEPVQIENIIIDSTLLREAYDFYKKNGNYDPYDGQTINCQISFKDPSLIENYYQLKLYRETESEYVDLDGNLVSSYFFTETEFYKDTEGRISLLIETDELFNGTLYTWEVKVPISAFYDFRFGSQDNNNFKLNLHFTLMHLSKDYYKYFETLQLQNIRNGDPFAQPVIVHNNIENGAGIFAGFSQSVFIATNN